MSGPSTARLGFYLEDMEILCDLSHNYNKRITMHHMFLSILILIFLAPIEIEKNNDFIIVYILFQAGCMEILVVKCMQLLASFSVLESSLVSDSSFSMAILSSLVNQGNSLK